MKWLAVLLLLGGAYAQTGPLGVEVAYEYVNYAHLLRKWSPLSGSNLSVDSDGWPMQDVMGVLFDLRPAHAWAPPIDDPEQRQLNLTGVWKLSLTGYAELSLAQAQGITLSNTAYNAATNQLTADITFAPGKYPQVADLVIVNFKNTRRLPNGQSNTGFVGLKFIHPDYVTKPTQMFTDNLAKLLQPFDHMRFMGILGTNYNPWRCAPDSHGDAISCSVLEWTDRALPSHAYFGDTSLCSGCVGTPWEYVVLLANQLNKDVWVNIPVSASGAGFKGTRTPSNDQQTYIYQIAKLLRDGNAATNNVGLAAHLNIYVEHSNEVWNYGFGQSGFNKAAAELAVKNGNSQLDNNKIQCGNGTPHPCCNNTSPDTWHNRRHAERLYQIAKEFETVFGSGSLNTRIRPIYAWWSLMNCLGVPAMNETLAWMEATYGPVKSYFYGLSAAHYFGPPGGEATVQATLEAYQRSSDAGAATTTALTALAKQYGLKHTAYEAGPGHDVGNQTNLATFIETNRNAGIAAIVERDVRTNFWALGGEIYNYFSSEGYCSMYGCWGATEDFKDLNTPKLQAIHALTGRFPNDQHSPGPIAKDPAA